MMIQAELKEGVASAAVTALAPFVVSTPKLYELAPQAPPVIVDSALAENIADAIEPRPKQPMRKELLQKLFGGHDTFWSQQGAADHALRNATAALSRALRPFSIWDSPLDLLFVRERMVFTENPGKGQYKGTRYRPTPLGSVVADLLKQRGVI